MRRRTLTVRLEKRNKQELEDDFDDETFERKADVVLHRLEDLGAKMFLGVCAYILLDTFRQVKVANAIHHPEK